MSPGPPAARAARQRQCALPVPAGFPPAPPSPFAAAALPPRPTSTRLLAGAQHAAAGVLLTVNDRKLSAPLRVRLRLGGAAPMQHG